MGLDSGGAPLDRAMPQYRLSLEDNADLIAYIRHLERDHDPGVADDLIRIGVILPPHAESTGLGEAIRAVLEGQVKAINERGGVYHRRLVLRFAEIPEEIVMRRIVLRDMTSANEPVFAILAPNLGSQDYAVPAAAEEEGVPFLGVIAPPARNRPQPGRWVFFLLAGPDDQAFALARRAIRSGGAGNTLAIVHGTDSDQRALANDLGVRCRREGAKNLVYAELSDTPESAVEVANCVSVAENIVLLGPAGRTAQLLGSLASRDKVPTILLPATLADSNMFDLPKVFDRHLYLAFPIAPSDQTAEGIARFRRLLGTHGQRRDTERPSSACWPPPMCSSKVCDARSAD